MKPRAIFGQKELADLLGITKQALYWRINHSHGYVAIPEPDYRISATRLWTYETIKRARLVPESQLNEFVENMNQISLDNLTK